jgi:hypothetical protein
MICGAGGQGVGCQVVQGKLRDFGSSHGQPTNKIFNMDKFDVNIILI